MSKKLIKLTTFFFVMSGFISSSANAIAIPFQVPNAFDPGQMQRNIQKENIQHKTTALPAVQNEVQPHKPIPGAEAVKFKLNGVDITGNTVFSNQQLLAIFASSLHKTISVAKLQELVQQITTFYREKGYILSRAILPPQEIKSGVVKIQVIEGFISTVTVTGKAGGSRSLIEEYGQQIQQSRPLNLAVLQRVMLLTNDLPGLSVKALIIPSKTIQDAADLTLVTDYKPISAGVQYNDYGTRYLGPIQSTVNLAANSIFAPGDVTGGSAMATSRVSQMQYYNVYHTQPINTKGLSFTIGSSYTATQPQFLLTPVEIVGMSASVYGGLTYAMIRSREQNLSLHALGNYQNVTSTILAFPLYQDRVRSLTLGGSYDTTDRWNGSDAVGLDLVHGFPILGAQMHALQSRPEGRAQYTRIVANFSRTQQPLFKQISLYTALSGQYSFQPLLSTEQFSSGGPIFGRGYGPSEIVGDEGLSGKVELRYDSQPQKYFLQVVEYYAFYDAGVIWNRDTFNQPARQDLTSTGVGVRMSFNSHVYGEVYVAKPLSRQCTTLTPLDQNPNQARAFFQLVATL